jgi:hypothetical protein
MFGLSDSEWFTWGIVFVLIVILFIYLWYTDKK